MTRKGLLEKYYSHIHKHPESLLSRFYGIFTVKIKYMRPINVVVMDNLIGMHKNWAERKYDLKGSTFQRILHNPTDHTKVRKDLNFLEDVEYRMHVDDRLQHSLLQRLHRDKEFLR
jgi:1-phosphatidylinositol-4-phosphate 5-kinase